MNEKRYEHKYSRFITETPDESRWSDEREIKESNTFIDIEKGGFDAAGLPLISNGKRAYVNTSDDHCIIFGSTGSKKTRSFVLPMVGMMIKAGESVVCTDPKGEIYANTHTFAEKNGYKVVVLNFRNFANGDGYNPLSEIYTAYHDGRQDEAMEQIDDFISSISADEKASNADPFWYRTASQLAVAHALLLMEIADKSEANISSFTHLCLDENYEKIKELSGMMSHESIAGMNYRCIYGEPEKTRQSTQATLTGMIQPFLSNVQLQNMMSETTFDMAAIGKEKTIVYIILSDEKQTYYFLVSLLIKQMYERLVNEAQKEMNGSLPVRVNLILDEFGSIPRISGFESAITAARSRNIRYYLIVQSLGQLENKYGSTGAGIIKGNCTDWVFLTSKELQLLNEISELCGFRHGRPLISVSELQRLKKCREYIETLILNGRNYPYIGRLPDMSLYSSFGFKLGKVKLSRKFGEFKLIDFQSIYKKIRNGSIPCPFSEEAKRRKRTVKKARTDSCDKVYISSKKLGEMSESDLQAELERKFDELFGRDKTNDKEKANNGDSVQECLNLDDLFGNIDEDNNEED